MTPLLATTDDPTARSDGGFEWGATLIRVPDLGPVRSRPTAAEGWERAWAEKVRARSAAARPARRRLRREFRVAACLCLAVAPLVTAVGAWGLAQPRRAGAAQVSLAAAIRLSIKPVEAEPEARAVLPGHVLPAERREEPSHEGS